MQGPQLASEQLLSRCVEWNMWKKNELLPYQTVACWNRFSLQVRASDAKTTCERKGEHNHHLGGCCAAFTLVLL